MSARMRMPAGDDDDWAALVGLRRQQIARFLSWAAEREVVNSMRLANRRDVARVREITDAFGEPWWAAVVYSCFDSQSLTPSTIRSAPMSRTVFSRTSNCP